MVIMFLNKNVLHIKTTQYSREWPTGGCGPVLKFWGTLDGPWGWLPLTVELGGIFWSEKGGKYELQTILSFE